ncbi:MAG: protein-export chaperone SecB [Rickettsiales bacterium]|nr:protein-export chaperone SecB [Rickettsiales bacterium]
MTAAADKPAIFLRAQYIKDLSFENPRAPASIFSLRDAPQMDVSINLGAQRLDENVFELSIHISTRAVAEKTTVFLCDVVYAGVIEMQGIAAESLEPTLFIQGAQLLYPFARRVIADLTRDGGFPPLQLDPMDFATLYQQRNPHATAQA